MKRKRVLSTPNSQILAGSLIASLLICCSGCSTVNVAEQRLVSKPNMVFSDTSVFNNSMDFHSLLEPGTAGSGGISPGGTATWTAMPKIGLIPADMHAVVKETAP